MKTMILFFLILLSTIANCQFSLQPRIGLNDNRHFVAAMDIAYRFKNLEGAAIINDVQNTRESAYFGYRIGLAIGSGNFKVMPITGKVFKYSSNDKLNENYWCWDFGFRVEMHLPCMVDKSAVFLQADYVDQLQFTGGVKF